MATKSTAVASSRELLVKARVAAQKFMPYLGSFIYSMRPVPREGLGTICVDINGNCYYDPDFMVTLSPTQAGYVLLHEVCHLLLSHCHRFQKAMPEFNEQERFSYNVAADLAVEQCLSAIRSHRPDDAIYLDGPCPQLGISHFRRDVQGIEENMAVEEYFWLLNKYRDQQQKKGGSKFEPGEGDGPLDPNKCGSSSDGVPRDYELPHEDLCSRVKVDNQLREVEQAMKQYERTNGRGSVPGAFKTALDWRLRPTPDPWQQLRGLVAKSVATTVGCPEYTYRKFSRRQLPKMPRLKGIKFNRPTAVLVIDTSGSMMDDETMSHCATVVAQGIRRVGRPLVVCGDTEIAAQKRVSALSQFEWTGGGGTDMGKIVKEVDEQHQPDAIILVTDGYTAWPDKPTRARLIIVLTQDETTPAWAKTIKVPKQMKGGK